MLQLNKLNQVKAYIMNMKKSILFALFLTFTLGIFAQINTPVTWSFSHKQLSEDTYELTFKASIQDEWHLYSMNIADGGPIKTSFNLETSEQYTKAGDVSSTSKEIRKHDAMFDMEIGYYEKEAIFTQVVKATNPTTIKGYVEYMSCNDETCTPPEEVEFSFAIGSETAANTQEITASAASNTSEISDTAEKKTKEVSYWAIFLIAFGSGFLALLTPCVFPMIPMTVSYFTKQSKTKAIGIRNGMIYGLFIILIYVVLGSLVTIIFGADALNALSTNPWFNTFFFILLVVFAISFLGAFEIVLPSKWVNKADAGADKGGLAGMFFMALTLALVSFSCTGPIVGTLLVQAASSGGLAPTVGMLGFGLALALPFALFAAFPGYLNSLPKSGGWLNSVKVILGFIELALAFKFLSMADLVLDLHLLEREVFVAIWIVIFGALGFYLLGKLRLPHDSPMDALPVSRLLMGLIVLSFTVYMIPGLWGAPLKLISAFPPPLEYSESPEGVGYRNHKGMVSYHATQEEKTVSKLEEKMDVGPQGINVFHDYDEALAYAKKVGKPLFLDFTGKACVNCRQMEINVWSDPEVKSLLKNDYVVAALYVDYRKKLTEEEQFISETSGKKIRTEGQKWSDFQISRYKTNSQPYYVLIDHNEKNLTAPRAFDLDVKAYAAWLKEGLVQF